MTYEPTATAAAVLVNAAARVTAENKTTPVQTHLEGQLRAAGHCG